jgi:uncharacterized protein
MPTMPPFAPPIGWPLLPVPNESGKLEFRSLEESVRDQVRVILLTRPGEQLMKPRFGAGLEDYVGALNTVETRRSMRDRINSALNAWEPRIVVDRVEVNPSNTSLTEVRVEIYYRLRRTGAQQRVALAVELKS